MIRASQLLILIRTIPQKCTLTRKEKGLKFKLPSGSQHKYVSDEFQKKYIFVLRPFRSKVRPDSMLSDVEAVKFYLVRTGDENK